MSEDRKPTWFAEHELEDRKAFGDRPTKEEMKQIVSDALVEFFTAKGKISKNVLVTAATVIGSLIVIGGGLKAVIGWFGFMLTKQ